MYCAASSGAARSTSTSIRICRAPGSRTSEQPAVGARRMTDTPQAHHLKTLNVPTLPARYDEERSRLGRRRSRPTWFSPSSTDPSGASSPREFRVVKATGFKVILAQQGAGPGAGPRRCTRAPSRTSGSATAAPARPTSPSVSAWRPARRASRRLHHRRRTGPELIEARDDKQLLRFQKKLATYKLLVDELGFVPLSKTGAELLFEVFSQRYERGSTLVTTNLPFDEWTEVFGSERLTRSPHPPQSTSSR